MCGIVGYTGPKRATEILMEGLHNLEYRGYDSAGVTVFEDGAMVTTKAKGRLSVLDDLLRQNPLYGNCGIGHTRWATHGVPADNNAHPHSTDKVGLVHNGIVENYLELREMLQEKGYVFVSETDTEVACKLIDYLYEGKPLEAIRKAADMIDGSYAFCIVFDDFKDHVYGIKKDNPLIAAIGEGENFILSDIAATLKYTKDYYVLEDGDMVEITPEGITILDKNMNVIEKKLHTANWDIETAQKGGFEHFMLKEIHEQPAALHKTIGPRIKDGIPNFERDNIPNSVFTEANRVIFVACGTASYAGQVGKSMIESVARIPVSVEIASEFRYGNPIVGKGDLVIIISQSGETADSLAALRRAKELGATTMAIVNVMGSSIAREAEYVVYTYAGLEIAVASTKAYMVQLGVLYLMAFHFAYLRGVIDRAACEALVEELLSAPQAIESALMKSDAISQIAEAFLDGVENLFFIGRGHDFNFALEGSLKLKEITYIHSEAYMAGELKHGPLALVTPEVPVIALAVQSDILPKTVSNMKEVKARGARTLLICKKGVRVDEDAYDLRIDVPNVSDKIASMSAVVALQLLAYHRAVQKNLDVDKPRNLAKSVTVE